MYQKSRVRWLKEGDFNSSFFHSCVIYRRRKNNLLALKSGVSWVEGSILVRHEVANYFKSSLVASVCKRPLLYGIQFRQLFVDDIRNLTMPFPVDEIKDAIWNCDGDKSPGSDGYNFTFFKKFWPSIKDEIIAQVNEFFSNSSFPKGVCSSFVSLVPKRENPQKLSDYRPISLIGIIHKLISKLVARLKKVIGPLISSYMSVFISHGKIMDGVLAVNEVLIWQRNQRRIDSFLKWILNGHMIRLIGTF